MICLLFILSLNIRWRENHAWFVIFQKKKKIKPVGQKRMLSYWLSRYAWWENSGSLRVLAWLRSDIESVIAYLVLFYFVFFTFIWIIFGAKKNQRPWIIASRVELSEIRIDELIYVFKKYLASRVLTLASLFTLTSIILKWMSWFF